MRLGLSLLNSKKLTAIQIASVEKAARERQLQFIDVLISTQTIGAQELAQHLSQQFQQPFADLAKVQPNPAGLDAVIVEALGSLDIVVLGEDGGMLVLGQSDPTRDDVTREAERMVQRQVTWRVVEHDKLRDYLAGGGDTALTKPEGLPLIAYEDSGTNNAIPTGADVEDAPVVRYLQKVLNEALLRGASDLHFEPFETFYRVRFRIDGALQEVSRPPISVRETLASRIKVLSRLDISEKRVPQDGRMKLQMQLRDEKTGAAYSDAIDFRVSTLPTLFGEKVVIRILESSTDKLDIDRLGYSEAQKNLILETIKRPYGMVLVTGPTGSGKTVSLYTFLSLLNKDDINIATAEDPVEIQLAGVNQVNMNDKAGLNFATALKAFLRQDPDIIMVGEIRDLETADIALKAAQTGHMVFSTLHTNDAPTTLTRLVNMGVAPFNVAASVLLITAQRLARRLCTECSRPASLSREAMLEAGFKEEDLDGSWRPRHAVGCPHCNGTGYRGRVGIYQVMPITEAIQEIILRQGTATDIAEQARKDGVLSLREAGLQKVKEGLTTIEEVIATTNE